MCIAFLHVPDTGNSQYKLIIASNRDEFLQRDSLPSFITHENDGSKTIAGRDVKEGGTWEALRLFPTEHATSWRFGLLTNFREDVDDSEKRRSRGHLIFDFLNSSKNMTALDFGNTIVDSSRNDYYGFNLLLGDDSGIFYHSNRAPEDGVKKIEPGTFTSVANALLDTPWPKLVHGKSKFETIINSFLFSDDASPSSPRKRKRPTVNEDQEIELAHDLISQVLSDGTLFPDPLPGIYSPEHELPFSSIFVSKHDTNCELPPAFLKNPSYGTRTSSVVIVRADGTGVFVEKNLGNDMKTWTTLIHRF